MHEYVKVYVAVFLYVDCSGSVKPVALEWEDGRKFKIDRVVSERTCPAEHVGAVLTRRYAVTIGGRQKVLYHEMHSGKWFVEKPVL